MYLCLYKSIKILKDIISFIIAYINTECTLNFSFKKDSKLIMKVLIFFHYDGHDVIIIIYNQSTCKFYNYNFYSFTKKKIIIFIHTLKSF